MPDLVQFNILRLANANLNVPRWQITGKIVDSKTQQTTIVDFTGANAVIFPTVLGNLTTAQQDAWVDKVVTELILRRFGIN